MNNKFFTIQEFSKIRKGDTNKQEGKDIILDGKTFDYIWNFVYENKKEDDISDVIEFLKPAIEKRNNILQAKNYVGVIQTKNGVTIEILPKIYKSDLSELSDEKAIRKIFIKMLKTLKDVIPKKFDFANLKSTKMPLLEIFIKMFADEVSKLIHKGIKSDYIIQEENLKFLKGKLKISEHIKNNYIHKERFFVQYDEFLKDIPENRLIKTTLAEILKLSKSANNQKLIRKSLFIFDEINKSNNIDEDFVKCKSNRLFKKDYELLLKWCKIFLKKESFTNYKGTNIAFALLFPMEKVFESYVAHYLKSKILIRIQDSLYHLIREIGKNTKDKIMFSIRPDIVAKKNNNIFIMDTKWKILSINEKNNFGISQTDLYQLFSYAKIYEKKEKKHIKLILIYPLTDGFNKTKYYEYNDKSETELTIFPFDLDNVENNEELIKKEIK